MLEKKNIPIKQMIALKVDEKELIKRIKIEQKPPVEDDKSIDKINNRIQVYNQKQNQLLTIIKNMINIQKLME